MFESRSVDLWTKRLLGAQRSLRQTHLCNGTHSYRILIENLENLIEWPFKSPFDDLLGVHEGMGFPARVQGPHLLAKQ